MDFIRFPKIMQFRDAINQIKEKAYFVGMDGETPIFDKTRKLPVLTFTGTVKLHGTNAAVARSAKGNVRFQSRERIISSNNDNAGFAAWGETVPWNELIGLEGKDVYLFGEWCGGSIQAGVALNQLDKMFVIFAVMVDGIWLDELGGFESRRHNIYHIKEFPTFELVIDFNQPEKVQNFLIEKTLEVENECPVAKAFGISGVGEGIVWSHNHIKFKTKGEKHSASKVKTLVPIDTEKMASIEEFLDSVVTENRLNQAIDFLNASNLEISTKSTGDFIRWVYNDIISEEMPLIIENGFSSKDIGSLVSKRAKVWFFEYLNK